MTRALLLFVAVAAPAVTAAQTTIGSGAVQFTDGTTDIAHGQFINEAECLGTGTPAPTVNLSWRTAVNSGVTVSTFKYTVYASNKESTTAPNCIDQPNTSEGTNAGSVGQTLNAEAQAVNLKPFPTKDFVTAAGYDCTTQADRTIYVCVQAYDGATKVGWAKGTLTLSVSKPGPPTGVGGTPADDGALRVSWTAPGSATTATDYRVTATAASDASNHETFVHQNTSTIITGLQDTVRYTLSVWARSEAGNESETPGTGYGTPQPVSNFWDVYRETPGATEQGGCATAAGGPVALLALAAFLVRLRRRA